MRRHCESTVSQISYENAEQATVDAAIVSLKSVSIQVEGRTPG